MGKFMRTGDVHEKAKRKRVNSKRGKRGGAGWRRVLWTIGTAPWGTFEKGNPEPDKGRAKGMDKHGAGPTQGLQKLEILT